MSTRERKPVDTYKPTVSEPKKRPKKAAAPKEKAVKASKKEKKAKEDKPKKANAYMLFAGATRPDVIKKNPSATFGETGKLIGALWNKLKESDKAEWKKKVSRAVNKHPLSPNFTSILPPIK